MIAQFPALGFSLGLSLALLVDAQPARAQDQTCDHPISAPGANTVGITISAPGTYCLVPDVITRPASLAATRSPSPRTMSPSI